MNEYVRDALIEEIASLTSSITHAEKRLTEAYVWVDRYKEEVSGWEEQIREFQNRINAINDFLEADHER